jgi:hypothetical protein
MKSNLYILIMAILILFTGCSKDEEFIEILPSEINFVKENGSFLTMDDCIDPNEKYYVSIKTTAVGEGSFKPTRVDYTVNGISYSMTFMRAGTQINAIALVKGLNIAQIVESGYVATINYAIQDEFELVE